jgi:hypothetical protein
LSGRWDYTFSATPTLTGMITSQMLQNCGKSGMA